MRNRILTIGTMGLAGLVMGGLMALPVTANAAGVKDQVVKRDEDTPDVVLVTDDDDDNDGPGARGTHTNTNTNGNTGTHTNTGTNTKTGTATNTRTGTRSGRDDSWTNSRKDLTDDGSGKGNVDHSRNHTNDQSRHNTRG
jgi:hypothetical protein